jgi:O-antigen ligase
VEHFQENQCSEAFCAIVETIFICYDYQAGETSSTRLFCVTSETSVSILSRIEFVIFVGFSFFIIPFSFFPGIVDQGLSLRFILLSTLIAVIAVLRLAGSMHYTKEKDAGLSRLFAVFCAGYVLVCLLSIFPAVNKAEAVFGAAKVFLFCSYIWLCSLMFGRFSSRIFVVAKAAVIASLCVSVLGILEYWGILRIIDNGWFSPGVTMLNKNLLSSYLFLCLGFTIFAIFNYKRSWRLVGLASYSVTLYVFMATQTRAVWLGCLVGALVVLCVSIVAQRRSVRTFLSREKALVAALAITPLIVAAAITVFKPAGVTTTSLAKRAATVVNPHFDSNLERLALWSKTVSMIREHPIRGVGAGNWKVALPKYGVSDLNWPDMSLTEVRPYNDFLGVAAETGVFGLLLYCGLFVLCAAYCVRTLRTASDKTTVVFSASLLFTLAGFAVVSFFDFPNERVEHLVLFGTVLAVCSSIETRKASDAVLLVRHWQALFLCAIVVGACGCLWIGAQRLRGDVNGARMRDLWENKEWQKAIDAGDRAASVFYTVEPSSTPLAWYQGIASFKLGNIDKAAYYFKRARVFHPWHLDVLNDLGACYNAQNDRLRAIECFSQALAVSPGFEPAVINLAALYYNTGQYALAHSILAAYNGPHADPRFDLFQKAISAKIAEGGCP